MPAPVIAQRIGWPYSLSPLKKKLAVIRGEYVGVDPADRLVFQPGELAQCDLWFPATPVPVGQGQERVLPVLVMVACFSRVIDAVMLPSRQGGDLLAGMWEILCRWDRVPKALLWDREAAIGGSGKLTGLAASFAGTLATRIKLAPARDPETKGIVERANGYLETSFLPGRLFASPDDFNTQLSQWLPKANQRQVRSIKARPVDLWDRDTQAMLALPPITPLVGLTNRVRLGRDYYVRVDTNDYSVDPRCIGRFVDVTASPSEVTVCLDHQVAGRHRRCWGTGHTITDPAHVATAATLRAHYQAQQHSQPVRRHPDADLVPIRALTDYDALFGVDDFTTNPDPEGTRHP